LRAVIPSVVLGRSQAVRQRILIPPRGGSNPPAPARFFNRLESRAVRLFSGWLPPGYHYSAFCAAGLGDSHLARRPAQSRRDLFKLGDLFLETRCFGRAANCFHDFGLAMKWHFSIAAERRHFVFMSQVL
jgi:hypothetical protein